MSERFKKLQAQVPKRRQPVYTNISGKYGAPLGRMSVLISDEVPPESVFEVPLEDGYDPGGVYWGMNLPDSILFVAVLDDGSQAYTRAANHDEAVQKFNS